MKINLIFSIATVAFLCSCAEEDGTVSYLSREDGHIVRIVAGFDPSTRTVLNNNNTVSWTSGDKICVNGVESAAASAASSGPLPAATAMFTVNSLSDPTGPYYCLYPSSLYTGSGYAGGVYPVELPSVQPYVSGTFAQDINPSAAYKTSGNASFKNLCGIVKMTVAKTGPTDVAKVRFLAKNEYVSGVGTVTITSSGSTLTMGTSATSYKYVDVEFSAPQAVSGETIYFVVPAQTYTAGLTIVLLKANGDVIASETTTGSINIASGTIVDFGNRTFPFTVGGSNIYWDNVNSKLTFAAQSDPDIATKKYYQGVYFKWGGLVGIDATVGTWNDNTSQVYFPSDMTANATWSHDAVANTGWSTYSGIPYCVPVTGYTWGKAYYHLPLTFNNYEGDICRFLTFTDDAPAGYWRIPTMDECGDTNDWTVNDGDFDTYTSSTPADGTYQVLSGWTYLGAYFPASDWCYSTGIYYVGDRGFYISASLGEDINGAWFYMLLFNYYAANDIDTSGGIEAGYSVRCVKN